MTKSSFGSLRVSKDELPSFCESSLRTAFNLNKEQTNSLEVPEKLTHHLIVKLRLYKLGEWVEGEIFRMDLKTQEDWNTYWKGLFEILVTRDEDRKRYISPASLGFGQIESREWRKVLSDKTHEAKNNVEWAKDVKKHYLPTKESTESKNKNDTKAKAEGSSSAQKRSRRSSNRTGHSSPTSTRSTVSGSFFENLTLLFGGRPKSPESPRKSQRSSGEPSSPTKTHKSREHHFKLEERASDDKSKIHSHSHSDHQHRHRRHHHHHHHHHSHSHGHRSSKGKGKEVEQREDASSTAQADRDAEIKSAAEDA